MEILALFALSSAALGLGYFFKQFGGLGLLLLTAPMSRLNLNIGFALKPFYIVTAILLGARMLGNRTDPGRFRTDATYRWIFLFVYSLFLVTCLNGGNIISFRQILVFFFVIAGSHLIFSTTKKPEDLYRLYRMSLATGFILGVTGFFFYLVFLRWPGLCAEGTLFEVATHDPDRPWSWPMLQSIEVSSNSYAMQLLPFLFISLFEALRQKRTLTRLYAITTFALLFLNLFLTFSRGAMISFLIVATLMLFYTRALGRLKWLALTAALFFASTSVPLLRQMYVGYAHMKGFALSYREVDILQEERTLLFLESARLFTQHPLVGIGQGMISDPAYLGKQSHNTYIELLAENGVFPFIFFSIVIVLILKRSLTLSRLARQNVRFEYSLAFAFGMLAILIAMTPTSAITSTSFWFQIALVLASVKVMQAHPVAS